MNNLKIDGIEEIHENIVSIKNRIAEIDKVLTLYQKDLVKYAENKVTDSLFNVYLVKKHYRLWKKIEKIKSKVTRKELEKVSALYEQE